MNSAFPIAYRYRFVLSCSLALLMLTVSLSKAQTLDTVFNPNVNDMVFSLKVQSDGKVLIGGVFTTVDGVSRKGLARLNMNGTLDTSFNPDLGGTYPNVQCLVLQADGKVLIGGEFDTVGGVTRRKVARLNTDGTLDAAFEATINDESAVLCLAVQPDNKVLIGGFFTSAGGGARNNMARLNADGSLDAVFNPDVNAAVYSLVVQADNTILVGGSFSTVNGVTRNAMARLNGDGTLDAGFNPSVTMPSVGPASVYCIEMQLDGKILIGGLFTRVKGITRVSIARLNADGTLDTGFNPSIFGLVYDIVTAPEGKIFVGGSVSLTDSGSYDEGLAKLNSDGTLESGFDAGLHGVWVDSNPGAEYFSTTIRCIAIQADGKVLLGGFVPLVGEVERHNVARIFVGPKVVVNPIDQSGYTGQSISFNVTASGAGTLTYQWRKNGVIIPMATNSSFTLSALNYRSAANYDVVVTDDVGSVTSEAAELTVLSPAPNISISPGDTTMALGGNLTFTATVDTGIPPFTYQWRKNSVLIAKATNPTLVLTNIQRTQEGIYDVVVKNAFGVGVSNTARLSLPPLVAVTANPADTAVNPGQMATFTVDVPGATAWQWFKNGVAIKNATASTLGVLNVDASWTGLYSVTVTTPAGKVTTAAAQLRVNDSGLLIYKLTGTGTAYEGTASTVAALSGYMVLDRAGQRGGLILGSKRGSQSIHSLEVHENLHTQSTGPVPKTQTVVSEMVADEFVLWVNGADSLLTIQKTLSRTDLAVGPATLKGYANSIGIGPKVRIETVSLTLALDAINSIPARQYAETVEQAMSRISQDMQSKGSALVE